MSQIDHGMCLSLLVWSFMSQTVVFIILIYSISGDNLEKKKKRLVILCHIFRNKIDGIPIIN